MYRDLHETPAFYGAVVAALFLAVSIVLLTASIHGGIKQERQTLADLRDSGYTFVVDGIETIPSDMANLVDDYKYVIDDVNRKVVCTAMNNKHSLTLIPIIWR